uniref:COP9 signalosome complex subunit 6 n=1 Tax=Lynceus sp. MCZ IZ 141354 TaxID=1930659 RepID=A0A9N6WVX0_9CRUS|nr:EOG090X08T4 [Lynceus sp. MCZ IZ 141354]
MEVDDSSKRRVMASSGTPGSVSVLIHPLVIMNISEHWTRIKAQDGKALQVLGALIGQQKGRTLEIMNSFELMFDTIDDAIILNREYYNTKEEQFKQVFSDMDFLGWYTTGDSMPTESDIQVHKQVCEINESPVLLKLNPYGRHSDLPINVYESVIDLINSEATMLFVELSYTLATEEAERIGVDHVARLAASEGSENSQASEHLQAQHGAVKMLASRVRTILECVKAMQRGDIPINQEILRDVKSLASCLPVMSSSEYYQDHYMQCNDVALVTYLGAITKTCADVNQYINKFNILFDRHGMGRKMRGIFL